MLKQTEYCHFSLSSALCSPKCAQYTADLEESSNEKEAGDLYALCAEGLNKENNWCRTD